MSSARATAAVDLHVVPAAYTALPPPTSCETLGMLREAERQLKSSLMDQDMVVTYLELVKVFVWASGTESIQLLAQGNRGTSCKA